MSDNAGSVAVLREVRAVFGRPEQMQDAVSRLSLAGFDRAEMSLPSPDAPAGGPSPEASKPASTDEDARQMRTLGASTAASVAAMAAAGITIATGGAAAPAVAAALLAGGAAGGATFAAQEAANSSEQTSRDVMAATGELVLAVRTRTNEKRSEAEAILQSAGATSVETIG